ncbi:MAG: HAMP domain-containing protein [Nitrospinae bacterium]|nr:HAMP domain-containing protein [Nitrospinota bacterium]
MHVRLNLRGKLIAVSIFSVLIALAISTVIDATLARRAFEERFKEDATLLAKELAAGFGGSPELDDWQTLTQQIQQIKEARTDVLQVNIFAKSSEGEWSLAASDEDPPTGSLGRQEMDSLKRGRTLADLQAVAGGRFWIVTTPIRTDGRTIGALQFALSWKAAEESQAKERRQMLVMLAVTVILVSVALTIFIQLAMYRPIKGLVAAMQQAEGGSLDAEVVPRGHDELAQLAEHFNRMLRKIRQDTAEKETLLILIQQFNAGLQEKIREATQALEERNLELQRVNEALFLSQRQLAKWERLSGMVYLSASIAHEIGTPLHSIAGYLHLLLTDTQLPDAARRRLKIIESQIDRIGETLRTMLVSMRQPEPLSKPLDLNVLLRDLLQLASPGMSLRNVRLAVRLAQDLPPVLADGNQLQQVFLNLLTNALDAMPAGGELHVESAREGAGEELPDRRVARSTRCAVIRIHDTGEGIPQAHLSKIFDPFFTTKEEGRGTGIGLAVCRQIIHAHGGTIEVQSQQGSGSTFIVRLPLHQEGEEA